MQNDIPFLHRRPVLIGAGITAMWIIICGLSLTAADLQSLTKMQFMMGFVSFLLPLVLTWIAVLLALHAQDMRAEAQFLRQSMDRVHKAVTGEDGQNAGTRALEIQSQLEKIEALTRTNDSRLSALAEQSLSAVGKNLPPRETAALSLKGSDMLQSLDQPNLPLGTDEPAPTTPISIAEFIRALNFPENADDKEGFRILRRALEDRELGGLIDTSKELLTLMAEDGVYMDDLDPDLPSARAWRAFASGKRGPDIAGLAGIRDKSALALTRARVKNDITFRDLVHKFLRRFDQVFIEFEKSAEDTELLQMSDTRTGRMFMLLGRVSGTFD